MSKGLIYSLITAIVFVTLEPVSKLIAGEVNPYAITFLRFLIGSVILIPFAVVKIKKQNLKVHGKDILLMAMLGILCICISMVLLQLAVKEADSPSLIAILFSSNSVFSILFAMLIVKEKLTKNKVIAIVLCVIGVIICADFSSGTNLYSVALVLISALTFSLYSVLSQKYMTKLGGSVQTTFAFILGSIFLLVALLFMKVDIVPELTLKNIGILAYLGIAVTGIGYWSYFKAIEKGGAIMGSFAFFIKPILTPFVTLFVNGIVPDVKVFIALLFIVGGSYFAVYKKKA